MRFTRVISIVLLLLSAGVLQAEPEAEREDSSAVESSQQADDTPTKPASAPSAPRSFTPSEEIRAETTVSFPADI